MTVIGSPIAKNSMMRVCQRPRRVGNMAMLGSSLQLRGLQGSSGGRIRAPADPLAERLQGTEARYARRPDRVQVIDRPQRGVLQAEKAVDRRERTVHRDDAGGVDASGPVAQPQQFVVIGDLEAERRLLLLGVVDVARQPVGVDGVLE